MFREAFNQVRDTGSNRDFGVTADSRLYFDLSDTKEKVEHPNGVDTQPVSFNPVQYTN